VGKITVVRIQAQTGLGNVVLIAIIRSEKIDLFSISYTDADATCYCLQIGLKNIRDKPMPVFGSANPGEPPDPGDPHEPSLQNGRKESAS